MGKIGWSAIVSIILGGLTLSELEISYLGYGLIILGVGLGVVQIFGKRGPRMADEDTGEHSDQRQEESPNAQQLSSTAGRDSYVAGRDIDKSVHIHGELAAQQPITPEIDGVIRGPNIFMRIQNTDGQPHRFKVVFHNVSGAASKPRVRDAWLPWDCSDFQMIGPKQSGMIQVAQADGEDKRVGKVIRFFHNKGRPYDGRLSEYVAFGGKLYLDLELQSDAELAAQGQRIWTLTVANDGAPVTFTPA